MLHLCATYRDQSTKFGKIIIIQCICNDFQFLFPSDRIFSFENSVLMKQKSHFFMQVNEFLLTFLKEKIEYLGNGCLVVKCTISNYESTLTKELF